MKYMARFFLATKEQQSAIIDIVEMDASNFFPVDSTKMVREIASCIELMVSDEVEGTIHQNIAHGLPQSPHYVSQGGRVTFLSGAREVGTDLAARLVTILDADRNKVLYLPHAYARPLEIESLQDEFDGRVMELEGRVYIRCSGSNISPELVRRALVSMICGYSVGWLLNLDLPVGKPCSAVVPVFDGEGWAILGETLSPKSKVN